MKNFHRTHQNRKTTSKRKLKTICYILLAIVVTASSVITYFGKSDKGSAVPTWNDVYSLFGVGDSFSEENTMRVHFIDVGQGDCTLISTDTEAILIDAGERNNETTVIGYIKSLGIDTLDYVVATHPHSDHIGSLDEVIDAFTVHNVIMPKLTERNTPTTSVYETFLKAVKRSGAKTIAAKVGNNYTVGKIEMTVLAPVEQSDDLNDMSVVLNVTYGETSFLFTGDAEKASEKLMLESNYADCLDVDVLKVGHHGSSTSTGKDFLRAVSPEIAVIPCGQNNDYGHPHKETVQLLNDHEIEILRTDLLGTVVIESDGMYLNY